MRKYLTIVLLAVFVPQVASAHCPLCTAGAGALAILAASLGVSSVVVGLLIGAFAVALGLWLSGLVKKQYVRFQKPILATLIFLGTVIPVMPFIEHYGPWYIPFIGKYGTTYTVNLYILGVAIGVLIMLLARPISRLVTKLRNKQMPFQGVTITIGLLVVVSIIIQLLS